jgi:hypothetical protein
MACAGIPQIRKVNERVCERESDKGDRKDEKEDLRGDDEKLTVDSMSLVEYDVDGE